MVSLLWWCDNSDKTLARGLRDSQCCFISFTRIFFSSWSLRTPMTLSKTSFFVLKSAEPVIDIACSFRDHFCHTYAYFVSMQICPLEHLHDEMCIHWSTVLIVSINLKWHFSLYASFFFYSSTTQRKIFYFLLHFNYWTSPFNTLSLLHW